MTGTPRLPGEDGGRDGEGTGKDPRRSVEESGNPPPPGDTGGPGSLERHSVAGLSGLTSRQASRLSLERRRLIVEQLDRTPGLNMNQLAEKTGMPRSLVDYHLRRLERVDLVVVKSPDGKTENVCFLERDEHLWENPRTRVLFGGEKPRNVALYVLENPGATSKTITEDLETSRRTVNRHLSLLEDRDLVQREREGRSTEVHPRRPLIQWNHDVGHGYEPDWRTL